MKPIVVRQLTKDEFEAALAIRIKVFVDEQNVPLEEEHDHYDATATHYGAFVEDKMVATARLVVIDNKGKIGRVAVLQKYRGQGIGLQLMNSVLQSCKESGLLGAYLGSQLQAMPFYEKLGFAAEGPVYDDAGIPHRDMYLSF